MNILVFSKYGRLGPSSRLRTLQYLDFFENNGLNFTLQALIPDSMLSFRYQHGTYSLLSIFRAYVRRLHALILCKKYSLILVEKESLPWFPLWIELRFLRNVPYVLDFDDAIFHSYDKHPKALVRWFFGRRLDRLMSHATLVIAGNNYLANRARMAGARWVEVLPTVVDLARYKPIYQSQRMPTDLPRIVWIGSPTTAVYLQQIRKPLQALSATIPFVFRVIGAGSFDLPGVKIEIIEWSEESEVKLISDCAIGVMPLEDSPWERGKCGYKLIQYMACGLPVVASPVGANVDIVQNNRNGFLAEGTEEWISSLSSLLCNRNLRLKMGIEGRKDVEEKYCLEVTAPKLENYLRRAASEAIV